MALIAELAVLASNDYRFVYRPIDIVQPQHDCALVPLGTSCQGNASKVIVTFWNEGPAVGAQRARPEHITC